MPETVSGFVGIAVLLAIAFLLSTNRKAVNPRIVLSALALQIGIAALVLYVPVGRAMIETMSTGVNQLLLFSSAGIGMVFGALASENVGFSFAINILPVIIFFSALMSVLYHIGLMQLIVAGLGRALNAVIGTGRVESLNAAANIFVGQTEAPLALKPYLPHITKPQLFAIMVSGLASVAGAVLAAYASMGINVEFLLAASFMSAPGGLLMAKIIMPDEKGETKKQDLLHLEKERVKHTNVILAAAVGAQDGMKLALNIGAMLIAFVSLIALLNGLLGTVGGFANIEDLSVQRILGYIFAPLMYVLSVPWSEAQAAGAIVGEKLIVNEFVAFLTLTAEMDAFSPRTQAILTFALCGFANLSSIAILLGGLGSLIPDRLGEIAKFGLRAVAAGSLSNLMSATIAGLLFIG
jgi:CNT family concentrative nucleoside transporter